MPNSDNTLQEPGQVVQVHFGAQVQGVSSSEGTRTASEDDNDLRS